LGPSPAWSFEDRRLYLCTPDRPDLERFVASCLAGGVDVVQLREKHLADGPLVERAAVAQRVCADHGVPFLLNDRPDLAAALGADGVHVGQDDVPAAQARRLVGSGAIVGLSTHEPGQLAASLSQPVDYISAGPVTPTPTKPGRPGTGLDYIAAATGAARVPVWVTGGVDPDTVDGMAKAGARHFVVVRWLTEADEPETHARALRQAIDQAVTDRAVTDNG
jgi:thiamine-phosphate pyrophosphorylase